MSTWKREGYEEGLVVGAQKSLVEVTLRPLNFQVGIVGGKIQAQIKKLAPEKLTALAAALLKFSKRSDLTEWLKQRRLN